MIASAPRRPPFRPAWIRPFGAVLACLVCTLVRVHAQETPPASQAVVVRAESVVAAERLYGALILATNDAHPAELPPPLRTHARQLSAFGYNQFRLLGEKQEAVPTGTEDWLVPSRMFYLRVDTRNRLPDGSGYTLGLQLFRENRLLVEVDRTLRRERPLFIRGPSVGDGQLIMLLMVL